MSDLDFLRGLNLADKEVRHAARRGMAKAGMRLMRDAVMDVPTTPLDEGTLRGSASVHVQGQFHADSSSMAVGGVPTPNRDRIHDALRADSVQVTVGFNTEYAAWLHENPDLNFTQEGAGAKYLEEKMHKGRDRYPKIVANEVRKVIG